MESMNDKDPFEMFLKSQKLSGKASGSLLSDLEKKMVWNKGRFRKSTVMIVAVALVVTTLILYFTVFNRDDIDTSTENYIEEPELPERTPIDVIASNHDLENSLPAYYIRLISNESFKLVFIDRPVGYFSARSEYADFKIN